MQIAKMFATLGFEVDKSGLTAFEAEMRNVSSSIRAVSRDVNRSNRKLRGMNEVLKLLHQTVNRTFTGKASNGITELANTYEKSIKTLSDRGASFDQVSKKVVGALERIDTAIPRGSEAWHKYASELLTVNDRLVALKQNIANIRALTGGRNNINLNGGLGNNGGNNGGGFGGGNGGGGFGGGAGQGQGQGGGGGALLFGAGAGLRALKPFLGSLAVGGALGGAYALKEAIATGREMDSMIFKLKAVSRGAREFQKNLDFVRNTSQGLALDVETLGNSYAQIFQGTKHKYTQEQIQKMFLGFSKYFKIMKLSKEDQKGALLGISQMFNKDKVQAQEATLQVGQRVAGFIQYFAQANGKTTAEMSKLMELGKTNTDMVVNAGNFLGQKADEMGTLAEALATGVSAQTRFENAMKWMSHAFTKEADPALAQFFDSMAEFVKILTPVIKLLGKVFSAIVTVLSGIFMLVKGLASFEASSYVAVGVVGLLVLAFMKFIPTLTRVRAHLALVRLGLAESVSVVKLLRGSMVLLIGVFIALAVAAQDVADANRGANNWVSDIRQWLYLLIVDLQIAGNEITIFWDDMTYRAELAYNAIKNLDFGELWRVVSGQSVNDPSVDQNDLPSTVGKGVRAVLAIPTLAPLALLNYMFRDRDGAMGDMNIPSVLPSTGDKALSASLDITINQVDKNGMVVGTTDQTATLDFKNTSIAFT